MSIETFSGPTRSYFFYDGTIELLYEHRTHTYYLVTPDGLKRLDGVTDTCHIIDKSDALIPWACKMMANQLLLSVPHTRIEMEFYEYEAMVLAAKSAHKSKLDEAANIGHIAHDWIERHIQTIIAKGMDPIPMPVEPQAASCCRAALQWMNNHNIQWLHTERKIYSKKWGFAGTMDGLCYVDSCSDKACCREEFKHRLSVADWKTSNYLYPEYLLQTAAYVIAYQEEFNVTIPDRWVIRLGKEDGEFEPWPLGPETFKDDAVAFIAALQLKRHFETVTGNMKERESAKKAAKKEQRKEAREAALAIKCNRADRYKGVRYPTCNEGKPCQTCLETYTQRQKEKQSPCAKS